MVSYGENSSVKFILNGKTKLIKSFTHSIHSGLNLGACCTHNYIWVYKLFMVRLVPGDVSTLTQLMYVYVYAEIYICTYTNT